MKGGLNPVQGARSGGRAGGGRGGGSSKTMDAKADCGLKQPRIAAPLFVPPTKDSRLAVRLKEEEERMGHILGWKFKVVERGWRTLRELLTKANLFAKEHCGREDCMACLQSNSPLDCRRRGLVYKTECVECMDKAGKARALYVGETARSGNERYNEHVEDADAGKKDSHMYKHWSLHHGGKRTRFQFNILEFLFYLSVFL